MHKLSTHSPKIIVHFGMHKTGSTSIQYSMFNGLADDKFHYVNLGLPNPSNLIVSCFKNDTKKNNYFRKMGFTSDEINSLGKKAKAKLSNELSNSLRQGKTAILSAETISQFKEVDLRTFISFLEQFGVPIDFFGYIRSPKGFMESICQEALKSGPTFKFELARYYPHYKTKFGHYETLLRPPHSFRFRKFVPDSFSQGCVVRDFCEQLGIDPTKLTVTNANTGLSLPALQLLYAYKRFGPSYEVGDKAFHQYGALNNFLLKLGGAKFRLHSALVEPVIAANRNDIRWMEQQLRESLSEDLSAYDSEAVRSEADLLAFHPDAILKVAERLGPEFARQTGSQMRPTQVAEWMHLLRRQLAERQPKVRSSADRSRRLQIQGRGASLRPGTQTTITERKSIVHDTTLSPKVNTGKQRKSNFLVFCVGRTGSSHLRTLLNSASDIVCHGEIFKPDVFRLKEKYLKMFSEITPAERDAKALEFIHSIRELDPELHFGFKLFNQHVRRVSELKSLLADPSWKKISILRDPIEVYASTLRAQQTHTYQNVRDQEPTVDVHGIKVHFTIDSFDRFCRKYRGYLTRVMRQAGKPDWLLVSYDYLNDQATLDAILEFIGSTATIQQLHSKYEKQYKRPISEAFDNWDELTQFIAHQKPFEGLRWSDQPIEDATIS